MIFLLTLMVHVLLACMQREFASPSSQKLNPGEYFGMHDAFTSFPSLFSNFFSFPSSSFKIENPSIHLQSLCSKFSQSSCLSCVTQSCQRFALHAAVLKGWLVPEVSVEDSMQTSALKSAQGSTVTSPL